MLRSSLDRERRAKILFRNGIVFSEEFKHKKKSTKKAASYSLEAFITPGTGLSFQAVSHQVLSLLTVFTVVFGMGTGVFRSHEHQEPLGHT